DDSSRAQTLGINVGSVTGLIWIFAGVLSAAVAILDVYQRGTPGSSGGAPAIYIAGLVPILAAAAFARFRSVPLALGSALVLGMIASGMSWNLGNTIAFEVLLFVIIAVGLALQKYQPSRGEQEAAAGYLSAKEARPIPGAIRHHHVVVTYIRWTVGLLALLVLASPFLLTPSQVSQESAVVIYAIVGVSLLILTGWAGQVSLGQFAFAAAGAYVTAILRARAGLDVTLCILIGGLAGSVVAALVGVGALRLRGLYLAVSTLAFSLAVADFGLDPQFLGRYLPTNIDRPLYLGVDLNDEKWFYYFCLFFLVLAALAVTGLRRSRTGRTLIAVRDNEDAGQSFGVNLFRLRLGAFVVSGFIAAIAGGLFALHQHSVSPRDFSAGQSVNIFLMVIIGGLGSIAGPILGAVYQAAFLLFASPIFALLGTGFGVLAVLLLFPGGLGAVVYGARDGLVRRVAIRYRVAVPGLLADARELAQLRRGKVNPKTRPGGGTILVPARYRLFDQWRAFRSDGDG
ncbi:MAG: branched-chain amino acid ABC transporter permease, partial [Candidatus Dormibacteria bacterium]